MLGKKILQFLRETGTPLEQNTNREIQSKSTIKIGYGIMLIGIFCPIFWISFVVCRERTHVQRRALVPCVPVRSRVCDN